MTDKNTKNYDHLLHIEFLKDLYPRLPHPLSREQHAFQFLPFDALDGYDDTIAESDRQVDLDPGLTEDEQFSLDCALAYLTEHLADHPALTVTYFQADPHKDGGQMVTLTDRLHQLDAPAGALVLQTGKRAIPLRLIRKLKILPKA